MVRASYATSSWLKTQTLNNIVNIVNKAKDYELNHLQLFLAQFTDIRLPDCSKAYFLEYIPSHELDHFHTKWDGYQSALDDVYQVMMYIKNILNTADNIDTVKSCVPENYWKHIEHIDCSGDATYAELYNQKCFDILEQAPMKNLLLGITDN